MGFENRPQSELKELLSTGASVEMSVAGINQAQLCELAAHVGAGDTHGHLILTGASDLPIRDLLAISAYANGGVLFK